MPRKVIEESNKPSNVQLHRPSSHQKYPKLLELIEKDIVREVAHGGKTPPEKICRSQITNQEGVRFAHRTDLCFSICRFSQVVFIPRAQLRAQFLFLFLQFLVLIHFSLRRDSKLTFYFFFCLFFFLQGFDNHSEQ